MSATPHPHTYPSTRRCTIPIITVVVAILTGCSATPALDDESGGLGGETTAASDPKTSQTIEPTAYGWLAGNRVTITQAEFDVDAGTVVVTADVENTSIVESFGGRYQSWLSLDTGAGAPTRAYSISSPAVAESTTEVEISFYAPADGLILEQAVLQLGEAGTRQWLVPLEPGAEGEGIEPEGFDVRGVADAAGFSFTATSAQLVPWTCADSDDYGPSGTGRVSYEPVADDKFGLLLWGDLLETVSYTGGNGPTTGVLTQPDGRAVNMIGKVWTVFAAGDRVEDYAYCFTVDEPGTGDYVFSFETYRGGSGSLTLSLE